MPDEHDDFESTVNLGGPDDRSCLVVTIVVPYTDNQMLRNELLANALDLRDWYRRSFEYGTSRGVPLTEERIQELADEAERGYDVEQLRPREPGTAARRLRGDD